MKPADREPESHRFGVPHHRRASYGSASSLRAVVAVHALAAVEGVHLVVERLVRPAEHATDERRGGLDG